MKSETNTLWRLRATWSRNVSPRLKPAGLAKVSPHSVRGINGWCLAAKYRHLPTAFSSARDSDSLAESQRHADGDAFGGARTGPRFRLPHLLVLVLLAAVGLGVGTQLGFETQVIEILDVNATPVSDRAGQQRFECHKLKYQLIHEGQRDDRATNLFLHPPPILDAVPAVGARMKIRYRGNPIPGWPRESLQSAILTRCHIPIEAVDEVIEEDMRGMNAQMDGWY